jgi:hypothetical protein
MIKLNGNKESPLDICYKVGADKKVINLITQAMKEKRMDTLSAIKQGLVSGKLDYRQVARRADTDVANVAGTLRIFLKYEPRCFEEYIARCKKDKEIGANVMSTALTLFPILEDVFKRRWPLDAGENGFPPLRQVPDDGVLGEFEAPASCLDVLLTVTYLLRTSPTDAVKLMEACTGKPLVNNEGFHPPPQHLETENPIWWGPGLLGKTLNLNPMQTLHAFCKTDVRWRFNSDKFKGREWHKIFMSS